MCKTCLFSLSISILLLSSRLFGGIEVESKCFSTVGFNKSCGLVTTKVPFGFTGLKINTAVNHMLRVASSSALGKPLVCSVPTPTKKTHKNGFSNFKRNVILKLDRLARRPFPRPNFSKQRVLPDNGGGQFLMINNTSFHLAGQS